MVLQHSLVIVICQSRSHGGSYHGESNLNYTRSVTEGMIMESVKVTKQIVDIILKTVCRYVSIRFKKSLSDDDDDVCSSCMHDRRSAKKTAVSIVYNNDEVSADLMWLTMFHTDECQIDSNPDHSGYQLRRIQRVTTFATSYSLCTTERAIGNPNENPRRGVRDPRARVIESRRLINHD